MYTQISLRYGVFQTQHLIFFDHAFHTLLLNHENPIPTALQMGTTVFQVLTYDYHGHFLENNLLVSHRKMWFCYGENPACIYFF